MMSPWSNLLQGVGRTLYLVQGLSHLAKNLLCTFGSKWESKGGSSYLGVKSGFHPQRPLSNPPTKTSHWIFHKKWLHAFFRDIGFLLISLPLSPSHLSNDRRHLDFFLIVRSDPTVCCCFVVDYQNGIRITIPILFSTDLDFVDIFYKRLTTPPGCCWVSWVWAWTDGERNPASAGGLAWQTSSPGW